jgi:hypothetical protein
MPKIAISYRRTDSDATGRIYDGLVQRYGKDSIFRDIDRIRFGVDFWKAVDSALNDTDVLLAIVGPNWRGIVDDGSIRIREANDLVRIEVETALKRDIPIIPVLISNATMPKPTELPQSLTEFPFRIGPTIDSGRNFDTDIARLIRSIDEIIEEKEKIRSQKETKARQADRKKQRAEEDRARKEKARKEGERGERRRRLEQEQKEKRQEQEERELNERTARELEEKRKTREEQQRQGGQQSTAQSFFSEAKEEDSVRLAYIHRHHLVSDVLRLLPQQQREQLLSALDTYLWKVVLVVFPWLPVRTLKEARFLTLVGQHSIM